MSVGNNPFAEFENFADIQQYKAESTRYQFLRSHWNRHLFVTDTGKLALVFFLDIEYDPEQSLDDMIEKAMERARR